MPALSFDSLSVGGQFPEFALKLDADLAARAARLFGEAAPSREQPVPAILLSHFAHVRKTLPGDVPDGTVVLRSRYEFHGAVPVGSEVRFRTSVMAKSEEAGRRRVTLGCLVLDAHDRVTARLEHALRWGTVA